MWLKPLLDPDLHKLIHILYYRCTSDLNNCFIVFLMCIDSTIMSWHIYENGEDCFLLSAVQILLISPVPSNGSRFTVFWSSRPCGPAWWLALLLIKVGDVETNPSPITKLKKVWICDIYHRQIHVCKQISKRCNMIEHWVNLRFAGISRALYTDTRPTLPLFLQDW